MTGFSFLMYYITDIDSKSKKCSATSSSSLSVLKYNILYVIIIGPQSPPMPLCYPPALNKKLIIVK